MKLQQVVSIILLKDPISGTRFDDSKTRENKMKFHLEFDIKKMQPPINHRHKLFLIGSCFTENIGEKLKKFKFSILENPHGILFNPVSVHEALKDCIENKLYIENDIFYFDENWHSWKHHSRFSSSQSNSTLQKINDSIKVSGKFLKEADYAMITLGSSWVYRLTEASGQTKENLVVANNHKAPATWFKRSLLGYAELFQTLENMIVDLSGFNSKLTIVFTISPVRHKREGIIENNRSKALLILAIHELIEKYNNVYYFPAYELIIDDLRDYRFYAEDLVHPNYAATEYVWEKMVEAFMSEETRKLMTEIAAINLAAQHKPFNENSSKHLKFRMSYIEKIKRLGEKYPFLDFKPELNHFENEII